MEQKNSLTQVSSSNKPNMALVDTVSLCQDRGLLLGRADLVSLFVGNLSWKAPILVRVVHVLPWCYCLKILWSIVGLIEVSMINLVAHWNRPVKRLVYKPVQVLVMNLPGYMKRNVHVSVFSEYGASNSFNQCFLFKSWVPVNGNSTAKGLDSAEAGRLIEPFKSWNVLPNLSRFRLVHTQTL